LTLLMSVHIVRPISNLPVLSKLLQCLIVQQLMDYLTSANLLPQLYSLDSDRVIQRKRLC